MNRRNLNPSSSQPRRLIVWRRIFVMGTWLATVAALQATDVTVTVENLAPANGNFLTPVWVGFHNGTFDIFNPGGTASAGLERLAEDGNNAPFSAEFATSGAGAIQATLGGGPIGPGQKVSMTFALDGSLASSRYFSWASMVIPSNDAFVANNNPTALQIFDASGNFLGLDRTVAGSMVWDAGTEVNDELPATTAFFGQAAPNTGTVENGVIHIHPGFMPPGSGGILDGSFMGHSFSGADFKQPGYQIARITIALTDTDNDGVPDDSDVCADTAPWDAVDAHGCSIAQLVPCDGPHSGGAWRNHGQYVSGVSDAAQWFLEEGLITEEDFENIVGAAGQSSCGRKKHR